MTIILASSSPRRKELLKKAVPDFEVVPADIDESVRLREEPLTYVARMAKEKALAVASKPSDIVIGCDTTVVSEGVILGKPVDDAEAYQVLTQLSGGTHDVLTSVYIKTATEVFEKTEVVEVTFYPLTSKDIENYIATGEHMGKAGSYGIQGQGALFVKSIKGDYYSIVGFPIGYVHQILKKID